MSQLYTVHLRQKKMMTRFDARNQPVGQDVTYVETSIGGCPSQLVATYRDKFPDTFVKAVAEVPSNEKSTFRASSTGRDRAPSRPRDGAIGNATKPAVAKAPAEDAMDYATALNRAVKDAA